MPRLLVSGEWYDAVAAESIYETDYEAMLVSHAPALYPTFHLVPFKALVHSDDGDAIPDLALIDKQYREWWVVEVELGDHPLRGHVEGQVVRLATADYGVREADYLADRNHSLDRRALREMMLGGVPRVLVLVNQPKPTWTPALTKWSAIIGVVEIFRSDRSQTILRINGDHPGPLGAVVSRCTVDPQFPSWLIVESPAALGIRPNERITLLFEGSSSDWKRLDIQDRVWLTSLGRFPLPIDSKHFVLRRDDAGRLVLEARRVPMRRSP